jgi:hypothetical protein
LVEHRAVGLPEQDVLLRVAEGELAFDLLVEVVRGILGFLQAVVEAVEVQQRAVSLGVGLALAPEGVLGHEFPVELAGAGFEQGLEGQAHRGFVRHAQARKIREAVVVGSNDLVRRFELSGGQAIAVSTKLNQFP